MFFAYRFGVAAVNNNYLNHIVVAKVSLPCDLHVALTCLVDLYSGAICHFVQQSDEAGLKLCAKVCHLVEMHNINILLKLWQVLGEVERICKSRVIHLLKTC